MMVLALPALERPFPHRLEPLPNEALHSFLFRLDRANGWPLGDAATLVASHATGWRTYSGAQWAAGTSWDLRRLAHLSVNPYEAMEALTWLPELRQATGDSKAGIPALGDSGKLRFCPVCLAETGGVPRFCLLPLVDACPSHRVKLVPFCGHGGGPYPPELDDEGRIRCPACRRELASAAGEALGEDEEPLFLDTWRAWTYLLGWRGGDDIRGRGYRTIHAVRRGYPLRNLGRTPSLEHLVTVFLALHIDPELVRTLERRPAPPCPNATCARYVPLSDPDPLLRAPIVERHCAECGARFVGRRILLCFDPGHGGRLPTQRSVRKALRRLVRWRAALLDVLREDLLAGRPITIIGAFRRAGVPLNANLRARRLGLVEMVRDAARRQRILQRTERQPFRLVTMAEYRFLRLCAEAGDWEDLYLAAREGDLVPNEPAPADALHRRWDVPDPDYGILDPLYDPARVAPRFATWEDLRQWVEEVRCSSWRRADLLTDRWLERASQARRDEPMLSLSTYPRAFAPLTDEARAFIYSDWPPHWLPALVDQRAARRAWEARHPAPESGTSDLPESRGPGT